MSFGNFWMGFQYAAKHGATISAWDRARGELGWSFDIVSASHERVLVATPEPQPRSLLLREAGFRQVYECWDSYNSGTGGDEQFAGIPHFLYIASIMHWYEQQRGSVQFDWGSG